MPSISSSEPPFAKESEKTRRYKDKLAKRLELQNEKLTPEAIAESGEKIRKWIADNAQNRVPVKEKLGLFNNNQNAAASSRKVQQLAEQLKSS